MKYIIVHNANKTNFIERSHISDIEIARNEEDGSYSVSVGLNGSGVVEIFRSNVFKDAFGFVVSNFVEEESDIIAEVGTRPDVDGTKRHLPPLQRRNVGLKG